MEGALGVVSGIVESNGEDREEQIVMEDHDVVVQYLSHLIPFVS